MVVRGAKAIFGDVHVTDPKLPLEENAEAVDKVDLAIADGFYFRSDQYHSRIVFVLDEIIVIGRSVLYFFCIRDDLEFINEIFLLVVVYPLNRVIRVAILSFSSFLLTMKSRNPCSSRNSLRWNPSGRSFFIVSLMTRGPAKPMRAPGSAILRSPSIPKEAEMPPKEGSVSREI